MDLISYVHICVSFCFVVHCSAAANTTAGDLERVERRQCVRFSFRLDPAVELFRCVATFKKRTLGEGRVDGETGSHQTDTHTPRIRAGDSPTHPSAKLASLSSSIRPRTRKHTQTHTYTHTHTLILTCE